MRILITGGTGFVGKHVVKHFRQLHPEATIFTTGLEGEEDKRFRPYFQDAPKKWKPDVLVHLAAIVNPQDDDEDRMTKVNVDDSLALFEKFIGTGCRHIVYASSAAVYGNIPAPFSESDDPNPLTPYARSKFELDLEAFKMFRLTGIPITGLRFSNVYGRGELHKGKSASVVYQMATAMSMGKRPRLFRGGEQKRDWVFVEDVASAVYSVVSEPRGGVLNVGSGTAVSFNEVVFTINNALNTNIRPRWIINPYEGRYQSHTELDISAMNKLYGWKPRFQIDAGVRRVLFQTS